MNLFKSLFPAIFLFVSAPVAVYAQEELNITITGFQSTKGKAHVVIYDQEKGYPTDPSRALIYKTVPINPNRTVTLSVPLDKTGMLAVAAYHDENSNGKMDANFIGIPTEGTGASNNAKSPFGPPKFRDAKFSFPNKKAVNFVIEY
jgi:uncharacterized protein (DUF2141 family)